MPSIRVRGEAPNIALLAQQLGDECSDQELTLEVRDVPVADNELRHADLVELIVSFALGVAGNAAYDGIRALIARAQARGGVEVIEEPAEHESDGHGTERSE